MRPGLAGAKTGRASSRTGPTRRTFESQLTQRIDATVLTKDMAPGVAAVASDSGATPEVLGDAGSSSTRHRRQNSRLHSAE